MNSAFENGKLGNKTRKAIVKKPSSAERTISTDSTDEFLVAKP